MKEKDHTDYCMFDKFPASARRFYTMPDPRPNNTNSFYSFLHGQEIVTRGLRIHDAQILEEQMKAQGVVAPSTEKFMKDFKSVHHHMQAQA